MVTVETTMASLRRKCSIFALLGLSTSSAFQGTSPVWIRCQRRGFPSVVASSNNDDYSTKDWQNFNPFDPSSTRPSSLSSPSSSYNRISLRKTQMQDLMSSLLDVAGDQDATTGVLESWKEFLLEPLEDDNAVLEADSIYKSGMTRAERYQTYRATMEERIQSARNSTVRNVLQKLSDFVLSNE